MVLHIQVGGVMDWASDGQAGDRKLLGLLLCVSVTLSNERLGRLRFLPALAFYTVR